MTKEVLNRKFREFIKDTKESLTEAQLLFVEVAMHKAYEIGYRNGMADADDAYPDEQTAR